MVFRKVPARPLVLERERTKVDSQLFMVEVLTVDEDRKVLTVRDIKTNAVYQNVTKYPARASSVESTGVDMPEQGSRGMACHVESNAGFFEAAVICWLVSDTNRALEGIATRAIDAPGMQGWNERKRGSYRKAYAGQQATTTSGGYSSKLDKGWDHSAADMSRDHMDADRSTRTQISGSSRVYTHAGLHLSGEVERPNANGVNPVLLPDGSSSYKVMLSPGAVDADRYVSGKADVAAFVENTRKIQEFSLDYILPEEALQSPYLDTILGSTASPWERTAVVPGEVASDDQTFMADQSWDHPYDGKAKAVGPTTAEGPTPRRKAFILETSEGTLVGSNQFDKLTYGKVLKPVVFPLTREGRFSTDPESSYLPADDSVDHVEARMAASAWSMRFPYEYNTTRVDITKEGLLVYEVGSTIPRENTQYIGSYEHPHGAGRSIEGACTGSVKWVVGKNRDEEEALDLQALGQAVIRLGADDASLPDARRTVLTQNRSMADTVQPRKLQYWENPKLTPGDAGDPLNKTGAENISLRAAFDGGAALRIGARDASAKRKHLMNGYKDAPGKTAWAVHDPQRKDSKSSGRPFYPSGDSAYAYHDLTVAGKSQSNLFPYGWSGAPVSNMDAHGLSLDIHAVRDVLLRIGANEQSGQSVLLDLAGAIVASIGADKQGRSLTATLDGGIEAVIGPNNQGKGVRLEINGDVDWVVNGNFHMHVTGDSVFESTNHLHVAKSDYRTSAMNQYSTALAQHTTEAVDIVHNQGLYVSGGE